MFFPILMINMADANVPLYVNCVGVMCDTVMMYVLICRQFPSEHEHQNQDVKLTQLSYTGGQNNTLRHNEVQRHQRIIPQKYHRV